MVEGNSNSGLRLNYYHYYYYYWILLLLIPPTVSDTGGFPDPGNSWITVDPTAKSQENPCTLPLS